MSKIRVLLTDDHTLFRKGIRTLLSREADHYCPVNDSRTGGN